MPWQDRLKEAAYTGPDGTRQTFFYEDVSKVISKKTHAHEFPDVDVTFVQDQGIRGRRYPLRVIFWGDSHDIEADMFENLLVQRGRGKLEHPLYGSKNVVPFGDITRNDALKTAGNQTIYEITFYESVLDIYPSAGAITSAAVDVAIESLAFALQFDASIDLSTPAEKAGFFAALKALLAGLKKGLKFAQDGTAKLTNAMARIDQAINNALDLGIGTPLLIASQLKALCLAPGRSLALLKDRLKAYGDLAKSIFSGKGTGSGGGTGSSDSGTGVVAPGIITPGVDSSQANDFHSNNVISQFMVLGTAAAVVGEKFSNKVEALEAVETLTDLLADQVEWSEANFETLAAATPAVDPQQPVATGQGSMDTGEAQQALRLVVALSVRALIESSFTLAPEKAVIIDRPRSALDLCAELYGEIDSFDDFVGQNNFTGDELADEIPRGRRVVFYA